MLFDLIYRYGCFDAYRIFIYCLFTFEYQKGLPAKAESPELSMVDDRRIELLTSSVSRKRIVFRLRFGSKSFSAATAPGEGSCTGRILAHSDGPQAAVRSAPHTMTALFAYPINITKPAYMAFVKEYGMSAS